MQRIAPGSYQISEGEGFSVTIGCTGTAYLAFGSINGNDLQFAEDVPLPIVPNMFDSAPSANRLHLHVVYSEESTNTASYTVTVHDGNGNPVDRLVSRLVAGLDLPLVIDIDLRIRVR